MSLRSAHLGRRRHRSEPPREPHLATARSRLANRTWPPRGAASRPEMAVRTATVRSGGAPLVCSGVSAYPPLTGFEEDHSGRTDMPTIEASTLYGNLNLLILKTVAESPRHGLAIARRILALSEDALRVEEGALYPALHRLAREGYLRAEWGQSENNRRAKYYELTVAGRALLDREMENWIRHTRAVSKVLELAAE
jgi:transcriptional regulator